MNYFDPYPLCVDETVTIAWKAQLAEAGNTPWLARTLAGRTSEFFPRFVTAYLNLLSLPRGARRSIQRRLARSRDVLECAPEWLKRREGRRLRYKLARSLAGAALLLAIGQSVQAATITVNTNLPGIAADGKCSLIEAIINANNDAATHPDCDAGSGADTIILPTGSSITLTNSYNSAYGAAGLPAITSVITIEGNGSKITGKKGKALSRLINVTNSGDLAIDKVILSGGQQNFGGAAFNHGALTHTDCTITGNKAVKGGGLYNATGGVLSIDRCLFSKNSAIYGGGVSNYNGTLTIEHSTFTGNRTRYGGAGVYNRLGTVAIQNSTFTGNRASRGGGIYHQGGDFTIQNTVISKNTVSEHGGGMSFENNRLPVSSHCVIILEDSTVASNISRIDGGGIGNGSCALTIRNSTISVNKAGDLGGGITNFNGTLTVENSSISGNTGKYGGGIWNQLLCSLINTTISQNKANFGGGVYNSWLMQLTLRRSLISGNAAGVAPEFYNRSRISGLVVANDFNLLGTNSNAGIDGFVLGATDIVPSVPITSILAPLANNGGLTKTHALVPGSPAIDAVPGADPDCGGTDQRGTSRPQGAGCDIGAFEK